MKSRRILVSELGPDATETAIREWLGRFGVVTRVSIFREPGANPVAVVEMELGGVEAAHLISRAGCWFDCGPVNVRQVVD